MWATISIYGALAMIAVVLYYLTRNTAKSGGVQNFWERLKQTSMSGMAQRNVTRTSQSRDGQMDEVDAVAVLEDMYREFHEGLETLRREFEQAVDNIHTEHRQNILRLQAELDGLRKMQTVETSPFPLNEPAENRHSAESNNFKTKTRRLGSSPPLEVDRSSESISFRILDELQQGKSPLEIASQLGVSLDEVHRVIQFMSQP